MVRRAVVLLPLLVGCGPGASAHAPWPDRAYAAAFLLDADARSVGNIDGPFRPHDPSSPAPAVERTLPEVGALHLVGLEEAALERMSPTWRRTEPERLRLEATPESCPRGRVMLDEEGTPRQVSLASLAPEILVFEEEVGFSSTEEHALPLDRLSVRVPEDLSRCVTGTSALVPFGDQTRLLEGVTALRGRALPDPSLAPLDRAAWTLFGNVDRLDDGRAVALSSRALYLIERGRGLRDDERHVQLASLVLDPEFPRRSYSFTNLWADPRPAANGAARVIVLLQHQDEVGATVTRTLAEFTLDAQGWASYRVLARLDREVEDAVFEPSGRFVAVGAEGLVLLLGPEPDVVRESTLDLDSRLLWHVLSTGEPARPHLVLTRGSAMFVGDLGRPEQALVVPADGSFREAAAAVWAPGGSGEARVLLSSFNNGYFLYEEATGWRSVAFDAPRSALGCAEASTECGQRRFDDRFVRLARRPGGSLLAIAEGCAAAFELHPERLCAVPVLEAGQAVAERSVSRRNFRALRVSGGVPLVGGREGTLLEVR